MASGEKPLQHTRSLSEAYIETETSKNEATTTSLSNLLSNTLVLHQTLPYLPVSALVNLAATNRDFRYYLEHTPGVFRHLDLSRVKRAQLGSGGAVDATETEDDVYSGPLRSILYGSLRRRDVLSHVQTLVLDGLSVTAELCNDIIVNPAFNVRILSIREVQNLNEAKLMQSLRYACRPTRPEGQPRLRGLYIFGKKDNEDAPVTKNTSRTVPSINWNHLQQRHLTKSSDQDANCPKDKAQGTEDAWYNRRGRTLERRITEGWAETMLDCQQALRFDAVLCTGPRHRNSPAFGRVPVSASGVPGGAFNHTRMDPWAVATFALGGCATCGAAPEGFITHGQSPDEELPLLAPPPLHSSNVKAACRPQKGHGDQNESQQQFVPRCLDCVKERYCFSCNKWWCESCYEVPEHNHEPAQVHIVNSGDDGLGGLMDHELAEAQQPKIKTRKISKSCWECDLNCDTCIADTQKICRACGGGYCIVHYEGSTQTLCDWCSTRKGRRCRDIY